MVQSNANGMRYRTPEPFVTPELFWSEFFAPWLPFTQRMAARDHVATSSWCSKPGTVPFSSHVGRSAAPERSGRVQLGIASLWARRWRALLGIPKWLSRSGLAVTFLPWWRSLLKLLHPSRGRFLLSNPAR